ncbi:hypothetical protein BDQ17DRAFT_451971 [Cyathus striatus]|nr:hypothetical protein BDQ17DRAFT_451971 [Cyathus striatus]
MSGSNTDASTVQATGGSRPFSYDSATSQRIMMNFMVDKPVGSRYSRPDIPRRSDVTLRNVAAPSDAARSHSAALIPSTFNLPIAARPAAATLSTANPPNATPPATATPSMIKLPTTSPGSEKVTQTITTKSADKPIPLLPLKTNYVVALNTKAGPPQLVTYEVDMSKRCYRRTACAQPEQSANERDMAFVAGFNAGVQSVRDENTSEDEDEYESSAATSNWETDTDCDEEDEDSSDEESTESTSNSTSSFIMPNNATHYVFAVFSTSEPTSVVAYGMPSEGEVFTRKMYVEQNQIPKWEYLAYATGYDAGRLFAQANDEDEYENDSEDKEEDEEEGEEEGEEEEEKVKEKEGAGNACKACAAGGKEKDGRSNGPAGDENTGDSNLSTKPQEDGEKRHYDELKLVHKIALVCINLKKLNESKFMEDDLWRNIIVLSLMVLAIFILIIVAPIMAILRVSINLLDEGLNHINSFLQSIKTDRD